VTTTRRRTGETGTGIRMGRATGWAAARSQGPGDRGAILRVSAVLCAAIFVSDLVAGKEVAAGFLYVVPVLISLWLADRRFTAWLAVACGVLVLLALAFAKLRGPGGWLPCIANHALALFALGVTASLGLRRIRVEDRMLATEGTATTLLHSLAEGVVTTDAHGRVTFINPVAEALLGWRREDATGLPLGEILRTSDGAAPAEPGAERVVTVAARDGRLVPVRERRSPIADLRGEVHGEVLVLRDETDRQRYEDALRRSATRDPVTRLANRITLVDRLELEVARSRRSGDPLALFALELHGLRAVNDSHGHAAGDALLRGLAQRLSALLRGADTVARTGGDEFALLLPGAGTPDAARQVASKVLEALEAPVRIPGAPDAKVGASIGGALLPSDAETADDLLRTAHRALGAASERGRGAFVLFREIATAHA